MAESIDPNSRIQIDPTEQFPTRRSLRPTRVARSESRPTLATPAPPVYTDTARAPRPAKKPIQHRIVGVFTVLLVPAIFVGTSIPSFAIGSGAATGEVPYLSADGQTLIVASAADGLDLERAGFKATTESQLEAARLAEARTTYQASATGSDGDFSDVTPRAAGDDYPWRASVGLSPLGYVTRQCTDFVAWRINRDAGYTSGGFKYVWAKMTPGSGSAYAWASQWKNNGWKTSKKPVKGAVAWFYGNHVAYVKSVDGDNVNLEEYNWNSDRSYHTRTMKADDVALFLYPPP